MNSVERIRNAIKMGAVDKLPLDFEYFGETDIKALFVKPSRIWKPKRYDPYYMDIDVVKGTSGYDRYTKKEDEWGTIWGYGNIVGVIGEALEYPIKDIADLENYRMPDPEASGRFDGFLEGIKHKEDKYIMAANPMCLFEKLHFLLGFNQTLMAIMQNEDEIERFLDRLVDFNIKLIRYINRSLGQKVHAFSTSDDWGTQDATFISPEIWRKLFKERYRKIIDETHKSGMDFWLHSDGRIEKILPDLIEIGVDVFQLPQTSSIRSIEEFGRQFAGKACFALYIDIQQTAVFGTEQEIIKEAEDLVKYWSDEKGSGAIAMDYTDPVSIGTTDKKRMIALKAFKEAFNKKLMGNL